MIFNLNFSKNLFLQPSLGGKEWLILIDGENKDNILDDNITFERMEMNRVDLEVEILEKFHKTYQVL